MLWASDALSLFKNGWPRQLWVWTANVVGRRGMVATVFLLTFGCGEGCSCCSGCSGPGPYEICLVGPSSRVGLALVCERPGWGGTSPALSPSGEVSYVSVEVWPAGRPPPSAEVLEFYDESLTRLVVRRTLRANLPAAYGCPYDTLDYDLAELPSDTILMVHRLSTAPGDYYTGGIRDMERGVFMGEPALVTTLVRRATPTDAGAVDAATVRDAGASAP